MEVIKVRLTYDQLQYIQKQYIKYLNEKLTLEKMNDNLQKHFQVNIDFKDVILQCKIMNKGHYDIGWKFAEIQ